MESPKTPVSSRNFTRKLSKIYSSTPRVIKRSKLPAPLDLQTITPPSTIKKHKTHEAIHHLSLGSSKELQSALESQSTSGFDENSPLFAYSKQNNIIHENCAICSDLMTTKLKHERILKLKCSHSCHHDCYSLYFEAKQLSEDDVSDISCAICGETDLQIHNEDESTGPLHPLDIHLEHTPARNNYETIPEIQLSGFMPNIIDFPVTPVDQMITNSSLSGFKVTPPLSSTRTASSTPTLRSSGKLSTISSPTRTTTDLTRPTISIISHKESPNVISNVVSLFTHELQSSYSTPSSLEEDAIKDQVHVNLITQLKQSVQDTQGIDFSTVPRIKLFDSFEISLDGINWEFIHSFIFNDQYLILLNVEMSSVIGCVMLRDHFSSFTKISEVHMQIYFKTSTLPELQIRSFNTILISKYEDYFTQLLGLEETQVNTGDVPLIQMTTNLWTLIDSRVPVPQQIKTFNELTAKGLDLPINLLKSVVPKPQRKPINLILVVQLFNLSEALEDGEYLDEIQSTIRKTLTNLEKQDRFGLVIQGRSGERDLNVYKSSYFGMISADWTGWAELIDELTVYKPEDTEIDGNLVIQSMIQSCLKLGSMIDEDELAVKKLVWLNNLRSDMILDESKLSSLLEKLLSTSISISHFDIGDELMNFNRSLVDKFVKFNLKSGDRLEVFKNYHFNMYGTLHEFLERYDDIFDKFKRVVVSNVSIKLTIPIELQKMVKFKSFEMLPLEEGITEIVININGLHDGIFKNFKFELENVVPMQTANTIEISYRYNKLEFRYNHKLEYSRLKDTVLVKREIELMVIDKLQAGEVDGLNQLIFDSFKGCSTRYLNSFKMSEFFLHFKSFVNYIDELVERIEDDKKRELLVIQLQLD